MAPFRADLRADRAADALVRIDVGLLVADGDGRAGYLQAALAADAFLLVHHALADVVLDALDEQARAARDDGGGDLGGKRVLHGLLHGLKILRIDDVNVLVAVGGEDVLDLQGLGDVALQVAAAAGVLLMTGHAGDGVVEHDGDEVALVVDDLGRAGHAAVEERRVAHDAEDLAVRLAGQLEGLGHAHADAEAAAHAHDAVQRAQRRGAAEGIAADIAGDHEVLVAGHRVEEAAVRAARAQCGRTGHGGDADVDRLGLPAEDALLQKLRIQLIELAGQALALTGDTGRADLGFHKIVELLDDVELLDLLCERTDEVHRQRIRRGRASGRTCPPGRRPSHIHRQWRRR